MSKPVKHIYDFDGFQIDVSERVLKRGGELIPLAQKSFDILFLLVERQGGIVTKDELLEKIWPGTFVEESNLAQHIYTLRKTLGSRADGEGFIATVPKRGYRFAAPVHRLEVQEATEDVAPPPAPPVEGLAETPASATPAAAIPHLPTAVSQSTGGGSRQWLVAAAFGIVLIGLVGLGGAFLKNQRQAAPNLTVSALTTTGNINAAAISPDGAYAAYATNDKPLQSTLWLEQLATANRRTVLPSAEIRYEALAFSPDGGFLYYIAVPKGAQFRSLYRISVLGGPARKLAENVGTGVAPSPSGEYLAYRGSLDERREAALFIAKNDGTEVRQLTTIHYPEMFQDPAWSPDGSMLVCGAGVSAGKQDMYALSVRVSDGAVQRISPRRWKFVGQMAWLAAGREVLMIGRETSASAHQIWRLNLDNGAAQQLTNDSNTYNRLSLAARAGTLAALQVRQVTNVWLVPANEPAQARQITVGAGGYRGGLAWTPAGKLVYESEAGSAPGISEMEGDGSNPRLLSTELTGRAYVGQPVVTPDGRYVVFVSDYQGDLHVWRMNSDGSNLLQLTHGTGEDSPACSPDGRWVYYTRLERAGADRPTIGRVSIEGGAMTELTKAFTAYPTVAPDGQTFACLYSSGPGQYPWRLAIYPIEGGEPLTIFPQAIQAQVVNWTPDGRALTYFEHPIGEAAKIWVQPVTGGAPQLLTEFAADRLFGLAWSPDGKQLACVRGLWASDVVLLKGLERGAAPPAR
jgi:eukaryotic-like serine/threonine-protein kinase